MIFKKTHCYICDRTKNVGNVTMVYASGMKDVVIPLCDRCMCQMIHIAQKERREINDRKTDI